MILLFSPFLIMAFLTSPVYADLPTLKTNMTYSQMKDKHKAFIKVHDDTKITNIKSSRDSVVEIMSPYGSRGTGTYVLIDEKPYVVTADHVVDDHTEFFIRHNSEVVLGVKIYKSETKDIALLMVPEIENAVPITLKKGCKLNVGVQVYFTGYPGSYKKLTTCE